MAIAIQDAAINGVSTGANVTVTAGTNLVAFAYPDVIGSDVTGVTLGGQAMTQIGITAHLATDFISLWYKINPLTGTQALAYSGSPADTRGIGFFTLKGVDQTNPVDNSGASTVTSTTVTATNISATITGIVSSGCWMIGCGNETGVNITGVSGNYTTFTGVGPAFFSSNGTIGTGNQAGGYTCDGTAAALGIINAAIKAAATSSKNLPLLGIGT